MSAASGSDGSRSAVVDVTRSSVADVTWSAVADRLRLTEQWMYDAECALHLARQTRVDAWVAAAADRLHEAILAHAEALRVARAAHAA